MTEADKPAFAVLMVKLAKGLRGEIDRDQMAITFDKLKRFSFDSVSFAVEMAIEKERFVPVPSVLIEYAQMAPRQMAKADLARASLPEFSEKQRKENREKIAEIMAELDAKYGSTFSTGTCPGNA